MYDNNFKLITIADIHFGKVNHDDIHLYNELQDYFIDALNNIEKEEHIDMICICGDLFDRVIKMNELTAKLIIDFMTDLCKLTNSKNIQLRMLKGTKTHDFNQLQIFKSFELEYRNFKMFHTVGTEEVNNMKILYIPEEYPDSIYKYYADYLNNTYDIILGHGMIDIVRYVPDEDSERIVRNAPVWKSKDLINICRGPIVFGHIHDMTEYKDKIYYCGSFSRFSFADTADKGFLEFNINKDNTREFEVSMYENESAPTYYTIDISQFNDMDSEKKINLINSIKKKYDYVKIKADKSNDDNIDIIKTITNNDPNIKMEVKNTSLENDKVDEKYEFILKRQYDMYETIHRFIKIKYDKDLSTDKIKELLVV